MNDEKFFDLHTTGIGYLHRARCVTVRKGNFWAVDISALSGSAEDVQYTRLDAKVVGQEARMLIERLESVINDRDRKVLVSFRVGDLVPEVFRYKKGERAGEYGVSLKCRLLKILSVKIDGQTYPSPQQRQQQQSSQQPVRASA